MKLSFLDNVFDIKHTNTEGLLIEAFGNDLFIPYNVLNEAKSEAPLYRVLGPNGCVSAIKKNMFNRRTSYGICFTRDKNYWIGDLDGVKPGAKLFQFRINQYKLASDYKIITIAESGYQRKNQRSESEERILETVKNVDRYLECIDIRKGYIEVHIERLFNAVEKFNSDAVLSGKSKEKIEIPFKLTEDLYIKIHDFISPLSRKYILAIATILDYKIPLGENFYGALDKFLVKHDCKKFVAPKVSSNFNELEAKVKEIQAKVPPQPSANPSEESPLIATFKANIGDYKKEFKSYGYQVIRITDLNYSLYKEMTFGNNYNVSKIDFSAVLTPSDILVTLTFNDRWEARDAMKKLHPLGYALEQKTFQVLFPMPIDINDFGSVMIDLENMKQCLSNGTPWFHGIVLEEGFKFNKAKLTYTRHFGLITMNVKINEGHVEVEVTFSNEIFAPESKSVQELKQSLADQYHLYSNGKHFRLTEFPKNFENLVKSVEIVSDRLTKAKKRYEDNEEMFLKILDQIRAAGFHDYSKELQFRVSTPYVDFDLDVDAEFWTVNVMIYSDSRLGKKGIKLQDIEFVKNNPLYTKINFGTDNNARLSLQSFDYLEKSLKDLTNLVDDFKSKITSFLDSPAQTAGVLEEPTKAVDNKSTFSEKVLLMLDKYEFMSDDDGSGIITFLKTFGDVKMKGVLFAKKDRVEVKLPVNTPTTIGVIKQVPTFDGVKHTGYIGGFEILSISKPEGFEGVVKAVAGQGKMRKGDLINRVYDLKFKKTGDPDHDDAIDRILSYIKKNQKVLKTRNDLGIWLLDTPKELAKYKLEFPAVLLLFYGEINAQGVKDDPIYKKFWKCKALSVVRHPFKTKDLNGNPCMGAAFYDAKTVSKYKIGLIKEALDNGYTVDVSGVACKVLSLNENQVELRSPSGFNFVIDISLISC